MPNNKKRKTSHATRSPLPFFEDHLVNPDDPPEPEEPPPSMEAIMHRSHLFAMESALKWNICNMNFTGHPSKDKISRALFRDHRNNREGGKWHVFAEDVTQEGFSGTPAQIRAHLLASADHGGKKSEWVCDKSSGGHPRVFDPNIEIYPVDWSSEALELLIKYVDEADRRFAVVLIEDMLKLIGHLDMYRFTIPDYENDPGNGALWVSGYVAVDGSSLYGWHENEVKPMGF